MKKLLVATLLLVGIFAVTFGLANNADAACSYTGRVVYYWMGTSYGYAYVQPRASTYAIGGYYFRVYDNEKFADLLSDALTSGKTVRVYGNAASCPTSGTWKYGGTTYRVYLYRGY